MRQPRSKLLEEFRTNRTDLTPAALAGHVAEFARDQHGSRFIQQMLESATADEKEAIFAGACVNEYIPAAVSLRPLLSCFRIWHARSAAPSA